MLCVDEGMQKVILFITGVFCTEYKTLYVQQVINAFKRARYDVVLINADIVNVLT